MCHFVLKHFKHNDVILPLSFNESDHCLHVSSRLFKHRSPVKLRAILCVFSQAVTKGQLRFSEKCHKSGYMGNVLKPSTIQHSYATTAAVIPKTTSKIVQESLDMHIVNMLI